MIFVVFQSIFCTIHTLSHFNHYFIATDPHLFWDDFGESPLAPAALMGANRTHIDPETCGRINIMGNIVQDSAPYLFPFIIEYSLIGAAVIYVMWRHIGRHARYGESRGNWK